MMDRDSNTISAGVDEEAKRALKAAAERGIELFNSSQYWDAHEAWEQGWTKLSQPLKAHLQSLIMGCAAFIHLEKGRFRPAIAVARRCRELAEQSESQRASGASQPALWIEIPGLHQLMQDVVKFEQSQTIPQNECAKLLNQAKTLKAMRKVF
ncbi:MAG: DUF309 domain-containing protein [Methylotenera sp.]|nr:DUF309 domain-containing protein [Oligoflexia bacterium]